MGMEVERIFLLLVLFQLKHFLADFPLQGRYMLGKFKGGVEWILPLGAHALVHAFFTLIICAYFTGNVSASMRPALLDFLVHFIMDRIKASPYMLGRFEALSKEEMKNLTGSAEHINEKLRGNKYFWWTLGFDQMVHHLTHYLIIWLLIR